MESRYCVYCSVISKIGMSVIETWLIRIKCSSRSRGPLNAGIATGGRADWEVSSAIRFSRFGAQAHRRPYAFHRLLGGRAGLVVAGVEDRPHDIDGRREDLLPFLPEALQSRVQVGDEMLLAVHTSARGGPALDIDDLDLGRRRVEDVKGKEIAIVRISRILTPGASRVGH